MTDFKFTENTIYSDSELYESLIAHFNKIAEIPKNKRFEWEDEETPETEFNIGYDFQKWIQEIDENEWPNEDSEITIKLFEPIKEYFDGFAYGPVGIYNGQTFSTKTEICKTHKDLVEFCKDLRQNSQTVFIFRLHETKYRPLISGDIFKKDSELVYGEEDISYKIRYIYFPLQTDS